MSTVQEIERAIAKLSSTEWQELQTWLAEFRAEAWDQQITADAQSGRLEAALMQLDQENGGHLDLPLDDFLAQKDLS